MWGDIFFFLLGALSLAVLAGGKEDYNHLFRERWEQADRSFTAFVRNLKEQHAVDVADQIASIFGFFAAVTIAANILLLVIGQSSPAISMLFIYSFAMWHGVKWYTAGEGKKFAVQAISPALMIFALPVMDMVSGANVTHLAAQPFDLITTPLFNLKLSALEDVWLLALIQFLIVAVSLGFLLLMMSLIFVPVVVSGVAVGLFSISLARFLSVVSPKRPMRPFMIILGILSLAYFAFK